MLQLPGTQTGSTVRRIRDLGFLALAEIDYRPRLELPAHSHPDVYLRVPGHFRRDLASELELPPLPDPGEASRV